LLTAFKTLRCGRSRIGAVGIFLLAVAPCLAQPPEASSAKDDALAPGASQDQARHGLSTAELDQLLAPIALYPDALLGQILMAATYPLDVVKADRWRQLPSNAALKGERLAGAVEARDWDPSVKSLVQFPRILTMMDLNLEWTERLGEAFLADQASVMDTVQRLRERARTAGSFRSNAEQVVSSGSPVITVEQPNPDTIYIPVYDPWTAYGMWPDPVFPPYYFPAAFDGVAIDDLGFGWFAVPVAGPLWGWDHVDWRARRIGIDRAGWSALNRNRSPAGYSWAHTPGVPVNPAKLHDIRPYQGESRPATGGLSILRPPQITPRQGMPRVDVNRPSQSQAAGRTINVARPEMHGLTTAPLPRQSRPQSIAPVSHPSAVGGAR
jgi:hypothetical protein